MIAFEIESEVVGEQMLRGVDDENDGFEIGGLLLADEVELQGEDAE